MTRLICVITLNLALSLSFINLKTCASCVIKSNKMRHEIGLERRRRSKEVKNPGPEARLWFHLRRVQPISNGVNKLSPGVKFLMHLFKMLTGHMRVYLCGGNIHMSQHYLDGSQVRTSL